MMLDSVPAPKQVARRRTRCMNRRLRGVAVVIAALAATLVTAPVAASDSDTGAEVRISARKHSDGRIEFGLQQRDGDTWSQRQLPRARFLPPTGAATGHWVNSTPLHVAGAEVRISARKHSDGRIEFGLQQRDGDTWSERRLPRARFLPTGAAIGHWLNSTPLTLEPAATPATAPTSPRRWTAVSAGGYHSCALDPDGNITCWGDNYYGQAEAPGGRWTAISAGGLHSCALDPDGTTTCWGADYHGQSGAPDGRWTATSAGGEGAHSCALDPDGNITCWGNDRYSQTDPPGGRWTAISAGGFHSCALDPDGNITCWGDGYYDMDHDYDYGRTDAPDGRWTAISAGGFHSCALDPDGNITCWGDNRSGQTDAPDGPWTAVTAGDFHSCALDPDGNITCWGDNRSGQTDAPDGPWTAVTAGGLHSCALDPDGNITCWGDNRSGQTDAPDGR